MPRGLSGGLDGKTSVIASREVMVGLRRHFNVAPVVSGVFRRFSAIWCNPVQCSVAPVNLEVFGAIQCNVVLRRSNWGRFYNLVGAIWFAPVDSRDLVQFGAI